MTDSIPVTTHSHGGTLLALLALTLKGIAHFLGDATDVQLLTNYVAIISGLLSMTFIAWQWWKQIKTKK